MAASIGAGRKWFGAAALAGVGSTIAAGRCAVRGGLPHQHKPGSSRERSRSWLAARGCGRPGVPGDLCGHGLAACGPRCRCGRSRVTPPVGRIPLQLRISAGEFGRGQPPAGGGVHPGGRGLGALGAAAHRGGSRACRPGRLRLQRELAGRGLAFAGRPPDPPQHGRLRDGGAVPERPPGEPGE